MALSHFFLDAAAHSDLAIVHGTHHFGLMALSICVSIIASTMALQTAHIARAAQRVLHYHAAIFTGALALGGGVWATHFIGMLAFELPERVSYSIPLTLLSLMPAFAASWLALRVLAMKQVTRNTMLVSGTLVGLGIGAMHYSGMAAIQTQLAMRYEPVLFVSSFFVAIALAVLALWVGYGLRRASQHGLLLLCGSGVVMGAAIAGMHYTGMAAVRFTGQPMEASSELTLSTSAAGLILAACAIMLTLLVVAINGLLRVQDLYRRMRESSARLSSILNTAVDGIITIDANGLIQDFNHSAERLFGWTAREVIGRNIKMLMPDPYQSAHDGYLQNYRETGTPRIIGIGREVVGLRKDDSHMPMRLAVGRVDLPGELLFVGFVTDISDRHALEASLREEAERAEQAAAAKSTFLANMSHEIRTPMNSIIGFTELLLQTELNASQRGHLDTVRQASKSLLRLINDILDTTKMEKGQFELESIDFSLRAVAMQIESSMRLGALAKQLTFVVGYPQDIPEYFKGDPLRMLQILNNLVGNAIKFTESGSVEMVFAYESGTVHIQVRDTGIGMSPEQTKLVFAPFAQADATISRRFGGTGLGTTIARQLVEQMGGSIEVESALGQGSTFHVRLPLPQGQRPVSKQAPETPQLSLPSLRILVADDVPQNLELLALTLQKDAHEVIMAKDGREALQRFTEGRFDVVLMDVHMPGLDGLQASRLIRRLELEQGRLRTPIVALTASVMAEDRHAAREAGMDGFAIKPLDVPQLFGEIARVVQPFQNNAPEKPLVVDAFDPETLIDWERGEVLWGEKARLLDALFRFLESVHEKYPLPAPGLEPVDREGALFSLHGIRGAAGNLALPEIARFAGVLESQLRDGQNPEPEQYARLHQLIAQARHAVELEQLQLAGATAAKHPGGDEPVLDLIPAMEQLRDILHRQELDDALLDTVCQRLDRRGAYAEAVALQSAVGGFEFAEAAALLERLLDDYTAAQH